jgi:hypothetical protein
LNSGTSSSGAKFLFVYGLGCGSFLVLSTDNGRVFFVLDGRKEATTMYLIGGEVPEAIGGEVPEAIGGGIPT